VDCLPGGRAARPSFYQSVTGSKTNWRGSDPRQARAVPNRRGSGCQERRPANDEKAASASSVEVACGAAPGVAHCSSRAMTACRKALLASRRSQCDLRRAADLRASGGAVSGNAPSGAPPFLSENAPHAFALRNPVFAALTFAVWGKPPIMLLSDGRELSAARCRQCPAGA